MKPARAEVLETVKLIERVVAIRVRPVESGKISVPLLLKPGRDVLRCEVVTIQLGTTKVGVHTLRVQSKGLNNEGAHRFHIIQKGQRLLGAVLDSPRKLREGTITIAYRSLLPWSKCSQGVHSSSLPYISRRTPVAR